ncbi:MAG: hypothetical protein ACI8ZN_002404 [Bacteroidia bacterium]|jgi:hypothetical protein
MQQTHYLILLFTILSTCLFSCGGNDLVEVKDTITSAEDHARSENQFYSAFDLVYDVVSTDAKLKKSETTILPSDASVSYVDSVFTDGNGVEIIVDFGALQQSKPQGSLCLDNIYRAGKLIISANLPFTHPDAQITVQMRNDDPFYCGNGSEMAQLTGTIIVRHSGFNALSLAYQNCTLHVENTTHHWESERIIRLVFDNGPGIWGDVYEVTGSASGVNRNGEAYTVSIIDPLVKKMETGCAKTFVTGKVIVSATGSNQIISVDYDPFQNGICDDQAVAEINGKKTVFKVQ